MRSEQEAQLRRRVSQLLEDGTLKVVLGYASGFKGTRPLFVQDTRHVDRLVWNEACEANLTGYLLREPLKEMLDAGNRIGLVVKGCDMRAVNVLIQEGQVDRSKIYLIGMVCEGVRDGSDFSLKCRNCRVQIPEGCDETIGTHTELERLEGNPLEDILKVKAMDLAERWAYWKQELSRCIKCYACRQACPMCYCQECITEKSRPQWIEKAPTLSGNIAYHFIRAIHLAGRCVSCGECSRACPMDIPVDMLTRFVAATIEEEFGYIAGEDVNAKPFLGTYRQDDPEDFIR